MRRRNFIKSILPLAAAPIALNGIPVRVMGRNFLSSSFDCDDINDRVLVLVQLHGGNDGLNTLIPLEQYGLYRNLRPLIGIKDTGVRQYIDLDTTLPNPDQIGLHPDLTGVKDLYDSGKAHIIQSVSYPDNNGSHFRGTDIMLTGHDGETMPEEPQSGWWGRYLDHVYPNYPDDVGGPGQEDPPGLEFGSHIISLGFHREVGIPMGLTIGNDPSDLASSLFGVGGALPTDFPDSDYGRELSYLVEMERSTNTYAQRLSDLYNAGSNTPGVEYPTEYHTQNSSNYHNRLSPQLKTVARLLAGGSKTKVFLVRMGGFDTHANQSLANKPSFGSHGALLYHLSGAMKAFMDDLEGLGLADRVMAVTFSEFGRQVAENGTLGTDHGSSAPMLLFGKGVKPGISGTNPDLTDLKNNKFASYQHDYRQVFTTILQDWFGANNGSLDAVGFYEFSNQKLDLVETNMVLDTGDIVDYTADLTCDPTVDLPNLPSLNVDTGIREKIEFKAFPIPARTHIDVSFTWDQMQPASLHLLDMKAQKVRSLPMQLFPGENRGRMVVSDLAAGAYVLRLTLNEGSAITSQHVLTQKVVVQ